jgi:hypothetical protein
MRGRVLQIVDDSNLECSSLDIQSQLPVSIMVSSEGTSSLGDALVKSYEVCASNSHLMSSAFSQGCSDISALMMRIPSSADLEPRFQRVIDRYVENLFAASSRLCDLVNYASLRQKSLATTKLVGLIEQLGHESVAKLDEHTLQKALALPDHTLQQYEIRLSRLLLKQALKMRPCEDNLLTIFDDRAFAYDLRSKQTSSYRSNVFELSSGITLLNCGTIVITGGFNHPRKSWGFDIKRQKIKPLPSMSEGRGSHCSLLLNNQLYVMGGRNECGELLDTTEIWNGETWVQGAKMNSMREGASSITIGNFIYVFGGSDTTLLSTGEYFDGEQWRMLNYTLPEALSAVGLIALSKTRVLIAGGLSGTGLSKSVYELRVKTGKSRLVSTLQRGDIFKSVGYVHEGRLLLMGSFGVHSIRGDWTSKFKPYKS